MRYHFSTLLFATLIVGIVACNEGRSQEDSGGASERVKTFFQNAAAADVADIQDLKRPDQIELIGKAIPSGDTLLLDLNMGQGVPLILEFRKADVIDIADTDTGSIKRVSVRLQERAETGISSVYVKIHYSVDLESLVQGEEPNVQADNDRGRKEQEVRQRFSGGHVYLENDLIPQAAEASVLRHVPDLIRWVLEHKGINVTRGNFELGHKTVSNWKYIRIPFDGKRKIGLPNTYLGYLGWKP